MVTHLGRSKTLAMFLRLLSIMLVSVLSPTGLRAQVPCREYQLAFLNNVLESYGAESTVDPTELEAHKHSDTWHMLFVIRRCPSAAMQRLSKDVVATKRWIVAVSDVLAREGSRNTVEQLLLDDLLHRLTTTRSNDTVAGVRHELIRALSQQRTPPKRYEIATARQWCGVVVDNLEHDWTPPDGYLMAAVYKTGLFLPLCPGETVSLLQRHPNILNSWFGNLDPAIFTEDTMTSEECKMGADMLQAAERVRTMAGMRGIAERITSAVNEHVRTCRF